MTPPVRCRVCHCTEYDTCAGGCEWTRSEPTQRGLLCDALACVLTDRLDSAAKYLTGIGAESLAAECRAAVWEARIALRAAPRDRAEAAVALLKKRGRL